MGALCSTIATARRASDGALGLCCSPPHPEASPEGVEPIATPVHDGSWCHPIAYLLRLLSVAQGTGVIAVEEAERLIEEGLGAQSDKRQRIAEDTCRCSRILIIGSGLMSSRPRDSP